MDKNEEQFPRFHWGAVPKPFYAEAGRSAVKESVSSKKNFAVRIIADKPGSQFPPYPVKGQIAGLGAEFAGPIVRLTTGNGLAAALVLRVKGNGQQVHEPTVEYDPGKGAFNPEPINLSVLGEEVYLVLYGTGVCYRSLLPGLTRVRRLPLSTLQPKNSQAVELSLRHQSGSPACQYIPRSARDDQREVHHDGAKGCKLRVEISCTVPTPPGLSVVPLTMGGER